MRDANLLNERRQPTESASCWQFSFTRRWLYNR